MQTAEQNVLEYNRVFPSELGGSLGRSRHYVALGLEWWRLPASPCMKSQLHMSKRGLLIALHCFETHGVHSFASADRLVHGAGSDDSCRPEALRLEDMVWTTF